jgi:hypothetical protein
MSAQQTIQAFVALETSRPAPWRRVRRIQGRDRRLERLIKSAKAELELCKEMAVDQGFAFMREQQTPEHVVRRIQAILHLVQDLNTCGPVVHGVHSGHVNQDDQQRKKTMANPFAKSRPVNQPYAIYRAGDMIWHVLKTYKQVKNEDTYARWMVRPRATRRSDRSTWATPTRSRSSATASWWRPSRNGWTRMTFVGAFQPRLSTFGRSPTRN